MFSLAVCLMGCVLQNGRQEGEEVREVGMEGVERGKERAIWGKVGVCCAMLLVPSHVLLLL